GGGFNSVYLRVWAIARAPGRDSLDTLLDSLPMEPEFVDYFLSAGTVR
ncbi:MAG: hypothetical protein JO276_01245, partial [Sphingomonadaceae bacterium]|nr:hypothetical protein [Sphingomonadaceae bacterium]